MADFSASFGLSDAEFQRGLSRVDRDAKRVARSVERSWGGAGAAIAKVGAAFVSIAALSRGFRGAASAAREFGDESGIAESGIKRMDRAYLEFRKSVGRSVAVQSVFGAIGAGAEWAARHIDTLSRAFADLAISIGEGRNAFGTWESAMKLLAPGGRELGEQRASGDVRYRQQLDRLEAEGFGPAIAEERDLQRRDANIAAIEKMDLSDERKKALIAEEQAISAERRRARARAQAAAETSAARDLERVGIDTLEAQGGGELAKAERIRLDFEERIDKIRRDKSGAYRDPLAAIRFLAEQRDMQLAAMFGDPRAGKMTTVAAGLGEDIAKRAFGHGGVRQQEPTRLQREANRLHKDQLGELKKIERKVGGPGTFGH